MIVIQYHTVSSAVAAALVICIAAALMRAKKIPFDEAVIKTVVAVLCVATATDVVAVDLSRVWPPAEKNGGHLIGTVIGSAGLRISGATVKVNSTATHVVREVTSDSRGIFTLPHLDSGNYTVEVSGP